MAIEQVENSSRKIAVVFIGGTGRSGTNITKKILCRHSQLLGLPFNSRFIIDPGGIIDFYNSFSSTWSPFYSDIKIKDLDKHLRSLSKKNLVDTFVSRTIKLFDKNGKKLTPAKHFEYELSRWYPNFETHVKKLIDDLTSFKFNSCWPGAESFSSNYKQIFSDYKQREELAKVLGSFLQSCISDLLDNREKGVFVNHDTHNILFAKELLEIMPQSKILHMVRDPRDVLASYISQRAYPNDHITASRYYKSVISKWLQIKKTIPKESYIEIKLENLAKQKEDSIREICNFVDIEFEDELVKYAKKEIKANSGRWEHEFNDVQKKFINEELKEIISELGYQS